MLKLGKAQTKFTLDDPRDNKHVSLTQCHVSRPSTVLGAV